MKTTQKKTYLLIKTISYLEAIVKANRPYQSENNRLNRSHFCDTVKSKSLFVCLFVCLLKSAHIRGPFIVAFSLAQLTFTTVYIFACLK